MFLPLVPRNLAPLTALNQFQQRFHRENEVAKSMRHSQRDDPLSRVLMEGGQVLTLLGMVYAHPAPIEQMDVWDRGNRERGGTAFAQGSLPHLSLCPSTRYMGVHPSTTEGRPRANDRR